MRSIGFISEKGGVAKTTTALNVAAAIGQGGRRVLVVDTDPQGNASHVLLRGEKPRRPTLLEVLTGDADPDQAIVPTGFDGVDVLPADASLADATVVLAAEVGRERRLREALDGVGGAYDFVLVDTAPTRSILTTNVLNAVQELIVPFTPGLFGVLGLGQLQGDVAQVRRYLENKTLRIGGIVLTQVEKNNVHRELEDQLRAMFGAARVRGEDTQVHQGRRGPRPARERADLRPEVDRGDGVQGPREGDHGTWPARSGPA